MGNVVNMEDFKKTLKEAEEDEEVLCVITISADSRVRTWLSDRVETSEQFNWVHSSIACATSEIVDMEGAKKPFAS